MGTRHLIAVYYDGAYRIAQYGQWDGYPNGQGIKVLDFLKTADFDRFKEKLKLVHFETKAEEKEKDQFFKEIGVEDGWMDAEQVNRYHRRYPLLTRDNGAKILQMVYDLEEPAFLQDSLNFAMDSLFCEWAYVINFDKEVLEVYKGFNQDPVPIGRFTSTTANSQGYYCIKLKKMYPLHRLPAKEDFIHDLEPDEE